MELEVYKKSDFYEDYISSQKEYYERENADAYFAERLAQKDKEIAELKQKLQDQCVSCPVKMQEDDVVAEKDNEIAELKEDVNNLLMQNRELCQALQVMYSAEEYTKLQNKNAELKQKLENVQASMYADVVDANMENRRLKRALWLLRSAFANRESDLLEEHNNPKMCWWADFANKCLKKAEEYK